jgi:hypothetical protein
MCIYIMTYMLIIYVFSISILYEIEKAKWEIGGMWGVMYSRNWRQHVQRAYGKEDRMYKDVQEPK